MYSVREYYLEKDIQILYRMSKTERHLGIMFLFNGIKTKLQKIKDSNYSLYLTSTRI